MRRDEGASAGRIVAFVVSASALAIGGGVLVDGLSAPSAAASELPAFENCVQLRHWVDRATAAEPGGGLVGRVNTGSAAMPAHNGPAVTSETVPAPQGALAGGKETLGVSGTAAAPGVSDDAVGTSGTGTNVQEAGVDEPDQIKTDGHLIVGVAGGRQLYVAEIANHTPHVIGRVRLDGQPTSLLLAGNRALVLVSPQIAYAEGPASSKAESAPGTMVPGPSVGSIAPIAPGGGRSELDVVELSDPHSPHIIAKQDVTGDVLTARQIGNVAWVVTQSQPEVLVHPDAPDSSVLPQRTVRNGRGTVVTKGAALTCSAVRHPTGFSGGEMLTVQPVDISSTSPFTHGRSAGVVANGGYVYASASRLYVATNTGDGAASTHIHAFDISKPTRASYIGSGTVRGTLLSQWSMSEQGGYLRVATTSGDDVPPPGEGDVPALGSQSQTSVVVLAERGARLVKVGQVSGLGRGERVWAVRFMGDLAAVVTFRQTDPLYLVDLSDPTAPRLRGAVSLTGYSAYLHPVGTGLLLGIGHEADAMGHVEDAKATLFDVSDPSHPRSVSSLDLGTGWSDIENDSHAFTYLPARHVALLPLQGDGSAATSIAVGTSALSAAGHLAGAGYVQRFVPVGNDVIAVGDNQLYNVDATSLDVLGHTPIST